MSYEDECNEYYFGIPFKKRVSAAEPAKFRVGDRVQVVKDGKGGSGHGAEIGETYTLKSWTEGEFWRTNGPDFYEDELAPSPTIAIGDRVKLKRHFGPHAVGEAGDVVVLSTRAGFNNATVAMDPWGVYTVFPVEVLEIAADCAERNVQQDSGMTLGDILDKALAPKPKFKAGDVVRNTSGGQHTIKCVKTIYGTDVWDKYEGPVAYDYTYGGWDRETDLTLVAPTQPCIVARVLDGQPRPSNIPFVHASSAEALTEAERLARNNPGQEFAVYQRVGARVAEVHLEMKEVA